MCALFRKRFNKLTNSCPCTCSSFRNGKIIHCRLISNPFYGLHRTPSKAKPENEAKLPWKFHEHVPPLNLRTSNRPCCTTGAQLSRLRMFSFFPAPASSFRETRCISRHVSPLFLNFWNVYTGHEASEWGRETGVHHHPKFTCESEGGKCSVFESGL